MRIQRASGACAQLEANFFLYVPRQKQVLERGREREGERAREKRRRKVIPINCEISSGLAELARFQLEAEVDRQTDRETSETAVGFDTTELVKIAQNCSWRSP